MFSIKDYYSILQVQPSATLPEIKQAYRKLAMQWHPDKNPGDAYALSQFNEIKEAYEVLTHPSKKEAYLQQRWYNQAAGRKKTAAAVTPFTLLKQALELSKYVSALDTHRMDKKGLADYILDMLQPDAIQHLKTFHESETVYQAITALLKSADPLPLVYTVPVCNQLQMLAGDDAGAKEKILRFLQLKQQAAQWDRWKIPLVILITICICLAIWFLAR